MRELGIRRFDGLDVIGVEEGVEWGSDCTPVTVRADEMQASRLLETNFAIL